MLNESVAFNEVFVVDEALVGRAEIVTWMTTTIGNHCLHTVVNIAINACFQYGGDMGTL